MIQVNYSKLAKSDLSDIWCYIAEDSFKSADEFIAEVKGKCRLLSQFPRLGTEQPQIKEGIFCFPVGNYLIFYEIKDCGIIINRVRHSRMDVL